MDGLLRVFGKVVGTRPRVTVRRSRSRGFGLEETPPDQRIDDVARRRVYATRR
jgi:hypothetical protein